MSQLKSRHFLLLIGILATCCAGCSPEPEEITEKSPRPVEVGTLRMIAPPSNSLVTAPVASWKTEQIGMEVSGRIEWVVEPNTDIEGRVRDSDGNIIIEGTPIAQIDKERFELQVQSAIAQVERATQAIKAAEIEKNMTIESQKKAAEAERKRAQIELNRSKRLVAQKAGAQSDVDRDQAALSTAEAQLEQLDANLAAKTAEIKSLESQLLQARDSLREAERSVEDCTLYSSFSGQITEVSVVPGSVVKAGEAVAQIQMMDPIKVEVEVSAEDSRRLRNRQRLPVGVTLEDGTTEEQDGFLYLVDPVADPNTRTFTLTLLMINDKVAAVESNVTESLPTTDQAWRVDFPFLPGADKGTLYCTQDAIYHDENGAYVWRVENMKMHGSLPKGSIFKVSRLSVIEGNAKIPFLGNWIFQEISIPDESFDPKADLISGKLSFKEGTEETWDRESVLVQKDGQWVLRPGDLVKVDLSNTESKTGLFVSMDSIAYEDEKTFLFIVDESGPVATVKRVQVIADMRSNLTTSSMVAVLPTDSIDLTEKKYVTKGAHYLQDGENVRIVNRESVMEISQ